MRLMTWRALSISSVHIARYCAHGAAHHAALRAAALNAREAFRVVVEAVAAAAISSNGAAGMRGGDGHGVGRCRLTLDWPRLVSALECET